MKKKLIVGLSALATLAAVGGTYAFLTDAEETENVFTIGNVDIALRSNLKDGETIKLMPNNTEKVKADYRIENTGEEAAYVWLRVKVPTALEDEPGLAANNIIHWNYLGAYMNGYQTNANYIKSATAQGYAVPEGGVLEEDTWIHLDGQYDVDLDGDGNSDGYNVYDILYTGAIVAGETTNVGVSTIFMDERVDKVGEDWGLVENGVFNLIEYDFNNGAAFLVEAHAIQANGFKTVEEAYEAYQKQWPSGKLAVTNQE